MSKGNMCPVDLVKSQFRYVPETGDLFRIMKNGTIRKHGKIGFGGYIRTTVRIDGRQVHMKGHRVAWVVHNGVWPTGVIDHVNGIRSDNRISNLRDVSESTNNVNRSRKNKNASEASLPIGVCRVKRKNKTGEWWDARCSYGGKVMHGMYRSAEKAIAARKRFEAKLFPEGAVTAR